jgi:hypothetical protein
MQVGSTWDGNYSRFTFDEAKRYLMMLKEQGVPILDDELNLMQEISLTALRRTVQDAVGDGSPNDGCKIVGTGAANNFTIKGGGGAADTAGHYYVAGYLVALPSDTTYSGQEVAQATLTTPGGARTDEVYLDVWLDEIDGTEDTGIVDPTLAVETSRRLKLMWAVKVSEGGAVPPDYTDGNGIRHHTSWLATLARTATAAIDAGMVTDRRKAIATLTGHLAAADPHPQYLTQAEGDARYQQGAHTHAAASESTAGPAEIATQAEVDAGTDATRIVTPATLATYVGSRCLWRTGDVRLTLRASAPAGWVAMNDGTIGDASSGGSTRANADCQALFTLLWQSIPNAWCPVSGGRGASAAADWAAHKTITLPRVLGRALAAAGTGQGLTARALGSYLGAETHTLTVGEMPVHDHQYIKLIGGLTGSEAGDAIFTEETLTGTTQPMGSTEEAGGGQAHNNLQPTAFLNVHIKL